jgi:hypothetical protein
MAIRFGRTENLVSKTRLDLGDLKGTTKCYLKMRGAGFKIKLLFKIFIEREHNMMIISSLT